MGQCSSWGSCARIQHDASVFCRSGDGTIEARKKRSAFDAGAYGRYPAADSGAFRTRFAALVDRNPHHAGADLRAVGPDSPQSCLAQRVIRVEQAYLPQLFFGLISLVLLFNI